jgi:hypothetical protein
LDSSYLSADFLEELERKGRKGRKRNEIYLVRIPFEDINNLPS